MLAVLSLSRPVIRCFRLPIIQLPWRRSDRTRPARGVSGMLNLSRNLGLVMGASAMAAVFALASAASDPAAAPPEAVTGGMQVTFWAPR